MAEAFVGVIIERLVSITFNKAGQELDLVTGVDKEIKTLTLSLKNIQALLEDAEQRQVQEGSVRVWLSNLNDVSEAIDEVLDEWSYEILKQQFVEKQQGKEIYISSDQNAPVRVAHNKKQQVCFPIPSPCCSGGVNRVVRYHGIAKKIKDLSERVASIKDQGKNFQLQDFQGRPTQSIKIQETSSINPDKSFGRDYEKKCLVRKLLNDDGNDYEQKRGPIIIPIECSEEQDGVEESLLPSINPEEQDGVEESLLPSIHLPSINPDVPSIFLIVGMGGIGKTTLSQLVYNDREVKAHFDRRIWVCVQSPFEEIQILAAIAQDLGIVNHPKVNALETYSQFIYNSIQNTKFFIVLDGVWSPSEEQLERVIKPLRAGARGSKVLVTTRNENTAYMLGAGNNIIHLRMLGEEDCEMLFFHFASMGSREIKEPRMREVGKEIVKKAQGLPLAAKTLGSLMHNKQTLKEWEDVLDSRIWTLKEFEQHVFQPLLLSYYDLTPTIRKCLLYCAIFPKDYLIVKFELIYLWMSQGYLWAKEDTKDIYMVGEACFNDLVMRSFFQDFETDDEGNIRGCKMHDNIREFLQFLSKSEFLVLDVRRSICKSPDEKVRHMFLTFDNETRNTVYSPFANLRTLIIDGQWVFGVKDIFKFKSLRALDLSKYWGVIPYDIGALIHLRYLKISQNPSKELPETLCDLYYLQTLILDSCRSLIKLPNGMEKLINLKHLDVRGCVSLDISGVEKLAAMQTLRLKV